MKRKRHAPEQIIAKLRDADAILASGATIATVVQQLGVSEQTCHRWQTRFGGMKASDTKRLKELELQNTQLKRVVANQALDIAMLNEIAEGNF